MGFVSKKFNYPPQFIIWRLSKLGQILNNLRLGLGSKERSLTHSQPMFHFYTLETIRKLEVFWCFQGVSKWNTDWKWVKNYLINSWKFLLIKEAVAQRFKKRLRNRCFSVNFVKSLRTPFFTEHLRWLLLLQYKKKQFSYSSHRKFNHWLLLSQFNPSMTEAVII